MYGVIYLITILTFVMEEDISNKTCGEYCCDGSYWNKTLKKCIDCEIGFYGVLCSSKCAPPYYGKECRNTCTCELTQYCHFALGCSSNRTDENEYQLNITGIKHSSPFVVVTTEYATTKTSNCTSKDKKAGSITTRYLLYAVITVVTISVVLAIVYSSTFIYEKITKIRVSRSEDNIDHEYENQHSVEMQALNSIN